ncbi:MAG: domain containing protein [Edaphobacter sp.]|nr:domain containing protein [Edaphobacter sp.]
MYAQLSLRLSILTAVFTTVLCLGVATPSWTQNPAAPHDQEPTAPDDTETEVVPTDRLHRTVAENTAEAWKTLTTALEDPKHPDVRIQALAALGTLSNNARAENLIAATMKDPDFDVRTASILAAGQTKNRNLTTPIRNMLDDNVPQVAFIAATTLWKMNDHSGEDILVAVVDGERKAKAGLKDSTRHTISKDLHSPSTLARIGALQGASMLLGPFGFGITAFEYMHKNGVDTSRVTAIEQISEEKTIPIRSKLIDALSDKDPAVRAAAAKALGTSYHDKEISNALLPVFDDNKTPVRLTAAAAYINATSPSPHARRRS